MPHRTLLRSLIALQLVLYAAVMILLSPNFSGNIAAQGGQTTQVDIYPNSIWGGVGGELVSNGSTTISITAGDVIEVDLLTSNTTCKNREIFAATTTIVASAITQIQPTVADTIAGIDPNHPHSITRMFTEQTTFNIQGEPVTLWSVETQGGIANFPQGIGLANGNLVFVTIAQGLAQGYNGEPINYQMLLPSGVWTISEDQTDTCLTIEEEEEEVNSSRKSTYQIVLPRRICTQTQFPLYAVEKYDRTFCEIEDIGPGCIPVPEQEISIEEQKVRADEEGRATYQINDVGQYRVSTQINGQIIQRTLTVNECSQQTSTPDSTISLDPPQISLAELNIPQLQQPETGKEEVAQGMLAVMAGITALICTITILYLIAKRDEIKFMLKLRIWLLEKFR